MLRKVGFACICFILLFAGCSVERNLARKYIKNHTGSGVLIIPAYEIYKDNLTISYDTAVKYLPEELDSIAWVQSCYIQYVSDSVFLTRFTNSFIDGLSSLGYDVYLDGSMDIFLSLPDPKWVVQIAQLQLNEDHRIEYFQVYSLENGQMHYDHSRINQVNLNSWLEVNRANTGHKQVLYLEGYIQDDMNIGVDVDLMEFSFGLAGARDSLEMDDIYDMAEQSGNKHAELMFDYFLNDYIRENLPAGIVYRQYFHYDPRTKSLKKGLKERFDVVK